MNKYQKCILVVLFSQFRYQNQTNHAIIRIQCVFMDMGDTMKFRKSPESFKKLNKKQWEDWNNTIFALFWKLWLIILIVQLFLFIFFEPTAECSRLHYFYQYIFVPSGLEAVSLLGIWLIFTKLLPSHNRRLVSIYTILLITIFAGVTVCVHTSVKMLQALLLLPMMLTPLYKDRLMTALQARSEEHTSELQSPQ